jgi:ParB-like chromosome segregation protein Spo0J
MIDLIASIKSKGLISALTVDEKHNLLAGGRRYKACLEAGVEYVPVNVKKQLSPVDRLEIELDENLQRKSLTWQEEVRLKEAIDDEKRKEDPNWSLRKTAAFFGDSVGSIHRDLDIAKAVKAIPELAQAKTKDEAVKKIQKMHDDIVLAEFAKRQVAKISVVESQKEGEEKPSDEQKKREGAMKIFDSYLVGDARFLIAECADASFDFANVDPPYGINLNDVKASQRGGDEKTINLDDYAEVDPDEYESFTIHIADEVFRVLKDNTWCVWWFGIEWYEMVKRILTEIGFSVDLIPCLWIKDRGQTNRPDCYFGRAYETFFLASKGKPTILKKGRLNTFSYPIGDSGKKIHAAEKPVKLMREIFSSLALPGSKIISPFLGSGNDIIAAIAENMTCTGFDSSENNKNKFISVIATTIGLKGEGKDEK